MSIDSQKPGGAVSALQRLFLELAAEVRPNLAEAEFFGRFIPRVAQALSAVAVVVWMREKHGLRLFQQCGLEATGLRENPAACQQLATVLEHAVQQGRPCLVGPRSAIDAENGEANPTPYLLAVSPLLVGQEVVGLVQSFQSPEAPPPAQRGHLRLLSDFCDLASQYLKERQFHAWQQRQARWDKFLDFNRRVHATLDLPQTALQVANEGRLLIGCERLSVIVRQGGKPHVLAISGQESLDKRAVAVRALCDLAETAMLIGEPIAYHGLIDDLAPQVATALQAHLEESPMRSLVIVPLVRPQHDPKAQPLAPLGALIAEQSLASESDTALLETTQSIAEPAASALGNALELRGVFLLPVWRTLGRASLLVRAQTLPKTLAVLAALLLVGLALTFIPADFKLEGTGVLQPTERREVFAQVDGDVRQVHVEHGTQVRQGDLLVTLQSFDLDVQRETLQGQRAAAVEHLSAVEISLLNKDKLAPVELARLHGERLADKQSIASLHREIQLLDGKIKQLQVRSPIDGEIVTWNITDTLMHRPLKRGEAVLSIVEPSGEWELEVRMPEDRMGHVAQARLNQADALRVSFVAAHQPDQVLTGRLIDAQRRAEVRGEEGNTVLLRVAIDKSQVRDLRPGAEVTARVHCGRRALGYVWFHDVLGFIQSRILFRLQ
ncbi:MAG: efflux RND transporter periplasmic adaptor subunit [Pirellulales bacterium]